MVDSRQIQFFFCIMNFNKKLKILRNAWASLHILSIIHKTLHHYDTTFSAISCSLCCIYHSHLKFRFILMSQFWWRRYSTIFNIALLYPNVVPIHIYIYITNNKLQKFISPSGWHPPHYLQKSKLLFLSVLLVRITISAGRSQSWAACIHRWSKNRT